jgi:hypothetical protein
MEPIDPISTPMVCSISTKLNLNGKVNKLVSKDRGNYLSVFGDLITVKTNHIWLTYFPRKLSWYVPDFQGTMDVKFDYCHGLAMEVKNCGYGWLHKQDLQEYNLTTMDPVDSLALKFKSLTIEDEVSTQLHSFI